MEDGDDDDADGGDSDDNSDRGATFKAPGYWLKRTVMLFKMMKKRVMTMVVKYAQPLHRIRYNLKGSSPWC